MKYFLVLFLIGCSPHSGPRCMVHLNQTSAAYQAEILRSGWDGWITEYVCGQEFDKCNSYCESINKNTFCDGDK